MVQQSLGTSSGQPGIVGITAFGRSISVDTDAGNDDVAVGADRVDGTAYFFQFHFVVTVGGIDDGLVHRVVQEGTSFQCTTFHGFRFWGDVSNGGLYFGGGEVQRGDGIQTFGFHQVPATAKVGIHYKIGVFHPTLVGYLYQIVDPLLGVAFPADKGIGVLGYCVIAFLHQRASPSVNHHRRK